MNGQGRLTIGLESGEGLRARLLDHASVRASWECSGLSNGGLGQGDGLRAVDEAAGIVSGGSELRHSLETVSIQMLLLL